MHFMQIFKKPGKAAYSYQSGARTIEEAARDGLTLAEQSPELWGEFLYARSPAQHALTPDELYVLNPSHLHVRYRKDSEELSGPLDYIRYSGQHLQDVGFPLAWKDPNSGGAVYLTAWFEAGKSFKFWDLCKAHLVRFVLRDGRPFLQFCHQITNSVVSEIPLQRRN